MLGHIDILTSMGVVEGWACDASRPLHPLEVAILDAEQNEIAAGLANLYRKDLAKARFSYGWCHFRLYVSGSVTRIRSLPVTLVDKATRTVLVAVEKLHYTEAADLSMTTLDEIAAYDPTILKSLDQIETFDQVFDDFIKARGVDAFVRTAYVYVLGRAIDQGGLKIYGGLLRRKQLTPYALLSTLAESDEFRSKPRQLVAPNAFGFPFRLS